jgi:hypothetical protein
MLNAARSILLVTLDSDEVEDCYIKAHQAMARAIHMHRMKAYDSACSALAEAEYFLQQGHFQEVPLALHRAYLEDPELQVVKGMLRDRDRLLDRDRLRDRDSSTGPCFLKMKAKTTAIAVLSNEPPRLPKSLDSDSKRPAQDSISGVNMIPKIPQMAAVSAAPKSPGSDTRDMDESIYPKKLQYGDESFVLIDEEEADFQRVKALCGEVQALQEQLNKKKKIIIIKRRRKENVQEQLKNLGELSRALNHLQTGIENNLELSEADQMSWQNSSQSLGQQDVQSNSGGLDDDFLTDDVLTGTEDWLHSKQSRLTRDLSMSGFTGGSKLPRLHVLQI